MNTQSITTLVAQNQIPSLFAFYDATSMMLQINYSSHPDQSS